MKMHMRKEVYWRRTETPDALGENGSSPARKQEKSVFKPNNIKE